MFLFSVSAFGQWTPPWMLLWIYKCISYKITFFEVKNKTEHIFVRATTSNGLFTSTFSKSRLDSQTHGLSILIISYLVTTTKAEYSCLGFKAI